MCIRDSIGIGAKDDFGQTYEEWFITDYDCYEMCIRDRLCSEGAPSGAQ